MNLARRLLRLFRVHPLGLLWLALCLPVAQAAAAWHANGHLAAAADSAHAAADSGTVHSGQAPACDLCIAGLALSATGPMADTCAPAQIDGRAPTLAEAQQVSRLAAPAAAYQSRAPPASTH